MTFINNIHEHMSLYYIFMMKNSVSKNTVTKYFSVCISTRNTVITHFSVRASTKCKFPN